MGKQHQTYQPQEVPSPATMHAFRRATLAGTAVIVIAAAAFGAWRYGRGFSERELAQRERIAALEVRLQEQTEAAALPERAQPEDATAFRPGVIDLKADTLRVERGGTLRVDWFAARERRKIDALPALKRAFSLLDDSGYATYAVSDAYRIGKVSSGSYEGYEVIGQKIEAQTMDGVSATYYILVPPDTSTKSVIVDRYVYTSSWMSVFDGKSRSAIETFPPAALVLLGGEMAFDASIEIPDLTYPTSFKDDGGREYLMIGLMVFDPVAPLSFGPDEVGKPFTVKSGDRELQISAVRGEFYGDWPDGRRLMLALTPPTGLWDLRGEINQIPQITWLDDGKKNDKRFYRGSRGGCGMTAYTTIVKDEDVGAVKPVATFKNGGRDVQLFAPTSATAAVWEPLGAIYDWSVTTADGQPTVSKKPADDPHSLFLYKDALGRWERYAQADYGPMAECGKPVIYLYPTAPTDVNVTLAPQGGFTVTEPAYDGGWRVHAEPDGALTDLRDGHAYPYLFWEGRGGMYRFPDKYWVISRANVQMFLRETLAKYGLNARETADFLEFWLPRMQAAPWYKIGFHGNAVMDMLAPLTIEPRPDSVLRLLMDFAPLKVPEPAQPPVIRPFLRHGFSVVEWGGTIEAGE